MRRGEMGKRATRSYCTRVDKQSLERFSIASVVLARARPWRAGLTRRARGIDREERTEKLLYMNDYDYCI